MYGRDAVARLFALLSHVLKESCEEVLNRTTLGVAEGNQGPNPWTRLNPTRSSPGGSQKTFTRHDGAVGFDSAKWRTCFRLKDS